MAKSLTAGELRALPATVDLVTGGRAFGLGRTTAYELARNGQFPCKLLRTGRTYRVITADLLRVLEISPENSEGAAGATATPSDERITTTA